MAKKDAKHRLIGWIILLQEFDYEIKGMKGSKSLVIDHLSRIVTNDASESPIYDCFPNDQLFRLQWSHGLLT